jgi:hypothetical protein
MSLWKTYHWLDRRTNVGNTIVVVTVVIVLLLVYAR